MHVADHDDNSRSSHTTCPTWCVADHSGPDDAGQHVGAGRSVAVAQRLPRAEGGFSTEIVEVVVVRAQDHAGPWLYAGDGVHQWLELTPESWRRVIELVNEELERSHR